MDGTSPTSIDPACSSAEQRDGMSNRIEKRPACAASPYTSGRALRYVTAPRRMGIISPRPAGDRTGERSAASATSPLRLPAAVALDGPEPGRTDVPAPLLDRRPPDARGTRLNGRHVVQVVGAEDE